MGFKKKLKAQLFCGRDLALGWAPLVRFPDRFRSVKGSEMSHDVTQLCVKYL